MKTMILNAFAAMEKGENKMSMRKIIFRAKRTYNGKWVEGFFVKRIEPLTLIPKCYILVQEEDISGITGEPTGYLNTEFSWYEVIPETFGQYTGLTDKNGKRIFEGDIVRYHNNNPDSEIKEIGIVFWDVEYCGWRRTSNGAFHHGGIDTYRMSHDCRYKVIGNIHDNPELMKGGEEK